MITNKHFPLTDSIRFEYVGMTQLSQATIDCSIVLHIAGKDVKCDIPPGVAYRLRTAVGKVTKFSTPHPVCVAWVGDRIVCVEGPRKTALKDAHEGMWKSFIEINLTAFHPPANCFFDGQYVYTLDAEPEQFDRNYGVLKLNFCRDLFNCNNPEWTIPVRACFAYKSKGNWVVTTPVTSATGSFLQFVSDDSNNASAAIFDSMSAIDSLRFVNLRFVNYAARELSNAFGYESIEPLGLPLLMIEHSTFNLGELTATVQMTCPAPLTFSQALAWLTGLHLHVSTLGQLIALKNVLKMLMSKGCTRKAALSGTDAEEPISVSKNDVVYSTRKQYNSMPLIEFELS